MAAADPQDRPSLDAAPETERQVVQALATHESWPRRAIAALRLERYGCDASLQMLEQLLKDATPQVRSFALRSLARRGIRQQDGWLAEEQDPRVIRTALRLRYAMDQARVARGARALMRQNDVREKLLGVELAVTTTDEELKSLATETARTILLRMDRIECGAISPRLAALTGQHDLHRPIDWQSWLRRVGRRFAISPGWLVPEDGATTLPLGPIASLDSEQIVGFESYMQQVSAQPLDLAICIDTTASMGGVLSAAQGGIDDMMLFVRDVTASPRLAVVAYRDRGDEYETRGWDLTEDLAEVRSHLWSLSADGGGDGPESLYKALKLAYTTITWRKDSRKVLIVAGDAPPHVGEGTLCVELAQLAHDRANLVTHVIQVKGKPVQHFDSIAKAGGGQCVNLRDEALILAEIAGLSLGDRYQGQVREFFDIYLELCR